MSAIELSVLIHTENNDLHGLLMSMALRERGHRVVRGLGSELAHTDTVEFRFGAGAGQVRLHQDGDTVELDQVDVVWNRGTRATVPAVSPEVDFDATQLLALQEAAYMLTDGAFWANPPRAVQMAGLRPMQLRMAPSAGLRIPETLVGNDPGAIRDFVAHHPGTSYQPLGERSWSRSATDWIGGRAQAQVWLQDLPEDRVLKGMPGVYQAPVARRYEVRAQFFGDTCFALKVDSQRIRSGGHETRISQRARVISEPVELPEHVHQGCRNLMDALGLVTCAFDFVVTPEGEWVFLDMNESAQFMFLEMWCPDLNVLDACCAFLESRDADFHYRRPPQPARLDQVYDPVRHGSILREGRLGVGPAMRIATG